MVMPFTPTDTGSAAGQVRALLDQRVGQHPHVPSRVNMESNPRIGDIAGSAEHDASIKGLLHAISATINDDISFLKSELAHHSDAAASDGIMNTISRLSSLQGSISSHMQNLDRAAAGGMPGEQAARMVMRTHASLMGEVRTHMKKRAAVMGAASGTGGHANSHLMSAEEKQWHNLAQMSKDAEESARRTAASTEDYALAVKYSHQGNLEQMDKELRGLMKKAGPEAASDFQFMRRHARIAHAINELKDDPSRNASVFMELVGEDATKLVEQTQAVATLRGKSLAKAVEGGTTFDARGNITSVASGFDAIPVGGNAFDTAISAINTGRTAMPATAEEQALQLIKKLDFVGKQLSRTDGVARTGHNIQAAQATNLTPLLNMVEQVAKSVTHSAPYHAGRNEELPQAQTIITHASELGKAFAETMEHFHKKATAECEKCTKKREMEDRRKSGGRDTSEGYAVLKKNPIPGGDILMGMLDTFFNITDDLGIGAGRMPDRV